MKKEVRCKKCKQSIAVKSVAEDRVVLARELGKEFELICPACQTVFTYHVNDVKAKKSIVSLVFVIAVMLIVTFVVAYFVFKNFKVDKIFYFYYLLGLISIPAVIFSIHTKAETRRISRFNRYMK